MLLLIAAVLALPSTAHARAWHWPVRGPVVQRFELKRDRFAQGQHRGIDIQTRQGTRVRAACAGQVRFAGTVPRHGRTVSVTCGPFVATYLDLSSMAVRRGQRLTAGQHLGATGARLHFGVRRAADRFGYIDPLTLLPATVPGPSPQPQPVPVDARRPRPPLVPRAETPEPPRTPTPIWAGLALLALSVPGLAVIGGRRRRARDTERRRGRVAIPDARG
jgi:murein DD-endopeptidase MepM/ murein hydrolase activator NlpD